MSVKSYILVKDWVDTGHAINSVAHAGAMMMLQWDRNEPVVSEWLNSSFKKVTCRVTEDEFERAKQFSDWIVVTELAFNKQEVVLVFKPRKEYPKFFKFLRLFK